jgi:hypothetical protein
MRFRGIHWLILIVIFAAAQAAAQNKLQVTAPNNQTFAVAGKDRRVNADELIQYTLDFYKKNSTNQSGVDLLIVDDRVALVQDRAGAVYLEKKPDPGAIKTDGKGYVLSGNGAARKWILANLKVGDAVKIGEAVVVKNSSGEVAPAASIPCFAGAYYRKAVSSFDVWTGIAGLVKLGTPKIDENRLNEKDKQPLDNFSVYMGGNAGGKTEVDAGLTWEFTLDENGKRSARRNAFRPFWRTKTWNSAPDEKQFYFYPGETVQMAVIVAGPNKLRLIVSDGKAKTFQTDFDAEGFAPNIARQFKRVNAIDQRYNEGKPVQPTRAEIVGAEWLQTALLRGEGAGAKQIPMDKTRFTDMRCANESHIVVNTLDSAKGAEKIDIFGTPKK